MSSILDNENFAILASPWGGDSRPSLVYVKKRNTGSGRTEVHILSAASNHKDFSLHVATGLHETHRHFGFRLADWDGDGIPDLWAIKKWATGTGKTEVHIYSGSSNFSEAIFHGATALHETGDNFAFSVRSRGLNTPPDLVAIKRASTGTNSTEVHILTGTSAFQEFALQTGTGLHETGTSDDWLFEMVDWGSTGTADLAIFSPANNGEIHVLKGPDYQVFSVHAPVEDSTIQNVLGMSADQYAIAKSCTLAALGVLLYWEAAPLSLIKTIATTVGTEFYALDCYHNIDKYLRKSDNASGVGGSGPGAEPHDHDHPHPPEPSQPPGEVPAPPPPPLPSEPPEEPPEKPPPDDPGDPGPGPNV